MTAIATGGAGARLGACDIRSIVDTEWELELRHEQQLLARIGGSAIELRATGAFDAHTGIEVGQTLGDAIHARPRWPLVGPISTASPGEAYFLHGDTDADADAFSATFVVTAPPASAVTTHVIRAIYENFDIYPFT